LLAALALKHAEGVVASSVEDTLDDFGLGTALAAPDIDYILGRQGLCAAIEKHHHLRSE